VATSRSLALPLTVTLALLLSPAPAAAKARPPRSCAGSLSGVVRATFACAVLVAQQGATHVIVISTTGPIEGVPSVVPGSFVLPGAPKTGTLRHDDLGMGKASVAVEGGTLYTAAKTSSQRGEVTLQLTSVTPSMKAKGTFDVHGTYRARLLPAGGGKSGEVVVEATF
jgi:hypothetical protein